MRTFMVGMVLLVFSGMVLAATTNYPAVTEKNIVPGQDGSYTVDDKGPADGIDILDTSRIVALDDEKLVDAYISVASELEASKVFHATSGFTPKDYQRYKDLIKYRMRLVFEIHRRKLEVPPSVN